MPLDQSGDNVPFPPVPSVLDLTYKFTYGSDTDVVTKSLFRYSGSAPTSANLATWLSSLDLLFAGDLTGVMHTQVALKQLEVTDLTSPSSGQAILTTTHAGTRTGNPLPASSCVLMNMKIGRRYRGGKPRAYWPFGSSTDLTNPQTWLPASVTAFNSALTTWFNDVKNATFPGGTTIVTLCSVSYYHGFIAIKNGVTGRYRNVPTLGPSPPYPIHDDVPTFTINPTVGSQRRRLRPG